MSIQQAIGTNSKKRDAHRAALSLWRAVLVDTVRGEGPDLTARQMALLTTVYLTQGPHTVKGLAHRLSLAKPAVTRALDTLTALDFVVRKRDTEDKRNVFVHRTAAGAHFLNQMGERIDRHAEALSSCPMSTAA